MINGKRVLYAFLVFVPVSFWLGMSHVSPTSIFLSPASRSCPWPASWARPPSTSPTTPAPGWAGLLNATFGNAAELIIAFIALRAGEPRS